MAGSAVFHMLGRPHQGPKAHGPHCPIAPRGQGGKGAQRPARAEHAGFDRKLFLSPKYFTLHFSALFSLSKIYFYCTHIYICQFVALLTTKMQAPQ